MAYIHCQVYAHAIHSQIQHNNIMHTDSTPIVNGLYMLVLHGYCYTQVWSQSIHGSNHPLTQKYLLLTANQYLCIPKLKWQIRDP